MSSVDIIIVIILLWGAWRGWRSGLIKEIFSACGFVVGLVLAAMFYGVVGEHFAPALGSGSKASFAACVLAFILIWVAVPIIFGFVANALTKGIKALHAGPLNSLLGMVVAPYRRRRRRSRCSPPTSPWWVRPSMNTATLPSTAESWMTIPSTSAIPTIKPSPQNNAAESR